MMSLMASRHSFAADVLIEQRKKRSAQEAFGDLTLGNERGKRLSILFTTKPVEIVQEIVYLLGNVQVRGIDLGRRRLLPIYGLLSLQLTCEGGLGHCPRHFGNHKCGPSPLRSQLRLSRRC